MAAPRQRSPATASGPRPLRWIPVPPFVKRRAPAAPGSIPAVLGMFHGDAQSRNMRTGPAGEVALLDWEDVSAAPGVLDLAWLLTSSTDPARWDEVIDAYGPAAGLHHALPAVIVQGLLSLTGEPPGSP